MLADSPTPVMPGPSLVVFKNGTADPNDGSIGKSCGAMFQGRHRLERMQVFAKFMSFK